MESQAQNLEGVLKNNNVFLPTKLALLAKLKANIKHQHVPLPAISPCFEVVRTAISSPELLEQGFSILSHLTKRLLLQDQGSILASQATKTYPYVIHSMGDSKDRVRIRAAQALTDFWTSFHADVEQALRDTALDSEVPAVKENAMQWIIKMNKEHGLQFKGFVPSIITCLGDTNPSVSEAAKITLIQLFRDAPDRAKADVRKHLMYPGLDATLVSDIFTELNLPIVDHPLKKSHHTAQSQQSTQINPSQQPHSSTSSNERIVSHNPHASSNSLSNEQSPHTQAQGEQDSETEEMKPIYLYSARELEDIFSDVHPCFEGKESDQNWERRKNSIIKLRGITKGNSPTDFTTTFLIGIKTLLEGILKVVLSLRTTASKEGCYFVQEVACAIGSNIDPLVEILLQSLVKLCGGTKTIDAQNGDRTVDAIMANASYSTRLTQHIWNACQDKNVRPRSYATGWLKTIINKYAHHKSTLEHGNGLDLIEKCIKKGLSDANLGVRESMRDTYWAYWSIFPERSKTIMNSLDAKQQDGLVKAPSNPDPNKSSVQISVPTTNKVAPLKETIAARKRAKMAELKRPESAQSFASVKKTTAPSTLVRPATSMATASKTASSLNKSASAQIGSLSSAPMRPNRLARKPELNRATSTTTLDKTPIKSIENAAISASLKKESFSPLTERKSRIKPTVYNSTSAPPKGSITSPIMDKAHVKHIYNAASPISLKKGNAQSPLSDRKKSNLFVLDDSHTVPTLHAQAHSEVGESKTSEVHSRSSSEHNQTKSIDSPTRLRTMTPDLPQTPIRGRKEQRTTQDDALDQIGQLSVYEDPRQTTVQDISPNPKPQPAVLAEMPVNKGNSLPVSSDLFITQKLLESGIARIQSGTLDFHGYRKLHGLIKMGGPIWADGLIFDQILLALFTRLKAAPENDKLAAELSSTDLRGQVLLTIRVLLSQNSPQFSKFCPQALCAILQARRFFTLSTHIVLGLEKLASEVVGVVDDPKLCMECIEAILELLETEERDIEGNRTITMGLIVLADLLGRTCVHLTDEVEKRLTQLSLLSLRAPGTDVRMAAIDYSMAVFDTIKPEPRFWKMASSASEDARSLLAYFLAKRVEH